MLLLSKMTQYKKSMKMEEEEERMGQRDGLEDMEGGGKRGREGKADGLEEKAAIEKKYFILNMKSSGG